MKSGSNLEKILTSGQFAVTGELGPPKNADPEVVRKKARQIKGHVDAVNITDCQTAIVRMSSIAAGLIAHSEGVEPVIQMTCRDRNRIGMQSDILGAGALGLKNLLCLTGDHQKFGNHPGSKGVFDMDSIQLLGMARDMRDGKKFQCGEEIKNNEPRLFLGCAANPFAGPPDFRARRLAKKAANGADFCQTQIVYNLEKFSRFMEQVRELGLDEKIYILAGVTPPKSLGMARYMKKFVPGLDVTDDVISRMKDARDQEDEGINICVDVINQVREIKGVAGVHVMAIEWESAVPEIVSRAGLDDRPVCEVEIAAVAPGEAITVRSDADALASARAEAERLIAAARDKAAEISRGELTSTDLENIETCDSGEDEMNEKERQLALESVRQGLDALKKAFGLSDDQFDALAKFAGAEAVLRREPVLPGTVAPSTPAAPAVKVAPVVPATPVAAPAANAGKAAEAKKAEVTKKAAESNADEETKKAAEAKKAEAAKKATEVRKAKEVQAAKTAETGKAVPAVKARPAAAVNAYELKAETTPLAERAAKVPENGYKQIYSGEIREVTLPAPGGNLAAGGAKSLPFHLFEGEHANKPMIAMDILDLNPEEWPETLRRHFDGVLDNPVAWAEKCVNDYNADAICLSMVSTDPNGMNRSSSDAAKIATEVIKAVDVPVILWGCGNGDKDTETLREVTAMVGERKVCLAPLSDANYKAIGATAMAFGHPVVAASPIDVNLAKQLNILLENLGMQLDSVLIDPSIGALGYGIEYSYSVMERIRIAALTQKDEKLQVPIICNLGREVWKAKEVRLDSDDMIGDQERRGVLMEAITASCMLMAGGEVMIMRHPQAISLTRALINGLMD